MSDLWLWAWKKDMCIIVTCFQKFKQTISLIFFGNKFDFKSILPMVSVVFLLGDYRPRFTFYIIQAHYIFSKNILYINCSGEYYNLFKKSFTKRKPFYAIIFIFLILFIWFYMFTIGMRHDSGMVGNIFHISHCVWKVNCNGNLQHLIFGWKLTLPREKDTITKG